MNWDAFGAIGESLGTLAVFVSLMYLAIQIRVQNKETRIASVHEITEAFRQSTTLISNPEIAQIYVRAIRGIETLEDWERMSFIATAQCLLRVWEEAFYQHSEGRLDEGVWKAMETQYSDWVSMQGVQEVWAFRKQYYRQEFCQHVEAIDLEQGQYRIE